MKRILSIVLSVLLMSTWFLPQEAAASAADVWDGSVKVPSSYTVIDGVYYYEISAAEELAYIARNGGDWLGYNYILANDIVLNEAELTVDENGSLTADAATLKKWTPIEGFNGVFNGNGYSISGVFVETTSAAGFFTAFDGDLYDVTIQNAYVKGKSQVGGIVSSSYKIGGEIVGCSYDGTVVGESNVGGIAGTMSSVYCRDCTNYGDVWAAGDNVGGIVGSYSSYELGNCVNEGDVYSTGDYVGGISGGRVDIYTFASCVNKGRVTGNRYVAGICPYGANICMSYCGNIGDIVGTDYVAGLLGYNGGDVYDTRANNGYNTGTVRGVNYVGGIVGYMTNCDLSTVYNVANISGETNVGAIAGYSDTIWGKGAASDCYYFKSETVNTNLSGFGNAPDAEGVTEAKEARFFCVNADKTVNMEGHTYTSSVTPPSDGQAGYVTYTCADCADAYREEMSYVCGDLNGDGKVSIMDAVQLYYHVNGKTLLPDDSVADMNGDGKVNISDAVRLYYFVNGKIGIL